MMLDEIYIGNVISSGIPKYLCLNTNLYLDENKQTILLGSVYQLLKQRSQNLKKLYGQILNRKKFGVEFIQKIDSNLILSFPTRYHWKEQTNIGLFKKSCAQIFLLNQKKKFIENIPIYIPIIVENSYDITIDDLIDYAQDILKPLNNVHIVPCFENS